MGIGRFRLTKFAVAIMFLLSLAIAVEAARGGGIVRGGIIPPGGAKQDRVQP
jgi:hypothetical protein